MALDPQYVLMQGLEEYFVDRNTGLPLSSGTIEFWVDDSRNTPKSVFQLTGAPPNYTYAALPNPLPLSIVGTPEDVSNDNIAIYYRPFDDFGNLELYYVVVKSEDGDVQFTREAWPNTTAANLPGGSGDIEVNNLLSNPQFVDVNFDSNQTLTISISGAGAYTYNIAPGWDLVVNATDVSTIAVTRNYVTGISKTATNPAYTLTITPGPNLNLVQLKQRLVNNPGVWSANQSNLYGWLATSISFGPNSSDVIISYVPSTGSAQIILQQANNTGQFTTYNNTVQLEPSTNADSSLAGYVDIVLTLPIASPITLSSIQCVSLSAQVDDVQYEQQPVTRQQDYLSHYYKPRLAYKPIPSYLVGWDFALNPAQIYGDAVAANIPPAIGVNKSKYVWDQTIVFQTADNGITVSRGTDGSLQLTLAVDGQVAVIQYLDQVEARKLLSDRMAVHIAGYTSIAGGLRGTVSLWATTDTNLPNCNTATNNSIVLTLDANGKPATQNGTWTEVPRNPGDGRFILPVASATNSESNDINLNGWDLAGVAPVNTATYFAIVIGFSAGVATDTINLNSIGLCAGDIATRPAPKTLDETRRDCERFYEMSYSSGTLVGTATSLNALIAPQNNGTIIANVDTFSESAFEVDFKTTKRTVNYNSHLYSSAVGTIDTVTGYAFGTILNTFEDTVATYWATTYKGNKSISYIPTGHGAHAYATVDANTGLACWLQFHYIIDARLGIVN